MSEKKLRVFAKAALDSSASPGLHEMYWAAVEDDPDLMALGRQLSGLRDKRQQELANTLRATYTLEEAVSRSFDKGAFEAIAGIVDLIETTVRLTDDGWEWVEEA